MKISYFFWKNDWLLFWFVRRCQLFSRNLSSAVNQEICVLFKCKIALCLHQHLNIKNQILTISSWPRREIVPIVRGLSVPKWAPLPHKGCVRRQWKGWSKKLWEKINRQKIDDTIGQGGVKWKKKGPIEPFDMTWWMIVGRGLNDG